MLQERTEDINMVKDYEDFKKFVLGLTGIDLNAYKEKQMKRRIDTLIARNKHTGYDSYCNAIKNDAQMLDEFVNYLTINVSEFYRNPALWKKLDVRGREKTLFRTCKTIYKFKRGYQRRL